MNKITLFHIEHKYYIQVKPLPNMIGCIVRFPCNSFINKQEINRTYIINNDPYNIELFNVEKGKQIIQKRIYAQKIAVRVLILQDILLKTLSYNISTKLILVENGKIQKNIFKALNVDMDENDILLEKELCLKFRNLLSGKVENDIDNVEIAKSYRQLLECFEKGELQ